MADEQFTCMDGLVGFLDSAECGKGGFCIVFPGTCAGDQKGLALSLNQGCMAGLVIIGIKAVGPVDNRLQLGGHPPKIEGEANTTAWAETIFPRISSVYIHPTSSGCSLHLAHPRHPFRFLEFR